MTIYSQIIDDCTLWSYHRELMNNSLYNHDMAEIGDFIIIKNLRLRCVSTKISVKFYDIQKPHNAHHRITSITMSNLYH